MRPIAYRRNARGLRDRLHYRLQRPARRAVERDEQAIARWVFGVFEDADGWWGRAAL
jgi:hypothetical protein